MVKQNTYLNDKLFVGFDTSLNGNLWVDQNFTINGVVNVQNNAYISGKLGIGTTSPMSVITAVVAGGAVGGEGWNNDWVVIGNPGTTGSGIGIGYNNSSNTGVIACLGPYIGWRNLQITAKGINKEILFLAEEMLLLDNQHHYML